MASPTLATLQYITRDTLASTISTNASLPPDTAIIDVRDSDHIGGHIRGSTWVPSSTLEYKMPELLRTLRDKEVVVFHCALSQQRGPGAALKYLREKERVEAKEEAKEEVKEGVKEGVTEEGEGKKGGQRVYVLKGGFTEWQEKYGEDKVLTEGYQKDIWEFGY
ncbi:Cdc25 family phosphatase-like protein Ibp1 [Boeremia exigua]|uniref:Cdc25 family phosphatase-like protein Ibp1 n=1 Tax=Boeremia exigua TaxID=749465 RepID=UPI001E8E6CD5|nr:Cdc25 family phosphatase-like protein Ibp1 [Boeremia exigua]KAH6611914.1 Cdc25 family phosphatase-like protein Ibp1 [Boeremia exigua]